MLTNWLKRYLAPAVFAIVLILAAFANVWLPAPPVHAQSMAGSSQYFYIATNATNAVKDGSGFLAGISLNGGTPGIVTLYDIGASGCANTPGSGKFATIEATGSTNPTTMQFDNLRFNKGLCVVTAAASDITVLYN